jgi:RimJ/RimL family protein N-acetyltransferase
MLAAFLDEVFRQGFGRVTSLVFTDNVKSHRLHEKLGFTRDSVIVGFVQNKDVTVWALNGLQWQRQRENFLEMINAVQVESL